MDLPRLRRRLYDSRRSMSLAIDWPWQRKGEDPMRYLDDVFRYAMAKLRIREDAEDVAIEVVQSLPSPCRRQDLRLYMIGMARRKVADRMRKRSHHELREQDHVDHMDRDGFTNIEVALKKLSDDHREALVLKYIVGLSSIEVGELTGKSPKAVDSLLQRARASFATAYGSPLEDEVKL
jgi:RNA polymerase sigma-70 factor (ECF subfamily)